MAKATTKNPKEITLYIRVDPDLKKHLQRKATELGLKISSYARMKLVVASEYKAPSL